MQVGDYVIGTQFNLTNCLFIGLIIDKHIDGYYEIEWPYIFFPYSLKYSPVTKFHETPQTYLTSKNISLYNPTLEELFIFKSFKEQS